MEKIFVSNLKADEPVHTVFLVREKNLGTGKNGRPYLTFILADRSGEVDARLWDNVEHANRQVSVGDFVLVKGVVQLFQNRKQVIVHTIEEVQPENYKMADFMPATAQDVEKMFAELLGFVGEVRNDYIRGLLLETLRNDEVAAKFKKCPAAKTIHHAYIGGLLEHVLSMCGIMRALAGHYKALDYDLLIFGAIYHDLGKIWELSYDTSFAYTDEGRLLGHHVLACEYIERLSGKVLGFPHNLKLMLKHIVLSHHDKLEFGSPKRPKFLEAFVVAMVDDLDSKINTMERLMEMDSNSGERWSRYSALFDRYFFLEPYRQHVVKSDD